MQGYLYSPPFLSISARFLVIYTDTGIWRMNSTVHLKLVLQDVPFLPAILIVCGVAWPARIHSMQVTCGVGWPEAIVRRPSVGLYITPKRASLPPVEFETSKKQWNRSPFVCMKQGEDISLYPYSPSLYTDILTETVVRRPRRVLNIRTYVTVCKLVCVTMSKNRSTIVIGHLCYELDSFTIHTICYCSDWW